MDQILKSKMSVIIFPNSTLEKWGGGGEKEYVYSTGGNAGLGGTSDALQEH